MRGEASGGAAPGDGLRVWLPASSRSGPRYRPARARVPGKAWLIVRQALRRAKSQQLRPSAGRKEAGDSTLNGTRGALGRTLLQRGRFRGAAPQLCRVAPEALRHRPLRTSGQALSLFVGSEQRRRPTVITAA
jgi:hypothetical protein